MKKTIIALVIAIMALICNVTQAQTNAEPAAKPKGFKIHSMYASILLSAPVGGLKVLVPSAGLGFKWGSIFFFYKPGIANGLLNFGLQTQYMNIESNVPLFKLDEDEPAYSLAGAANLGPVVSVKPVGDLQVDLYYMFGTGVRLFPNQDEYLYAGYAHPSDAHTRFTQSVGVGFHWKALYSTLGLQMMNYKYTLYKNDNIFDPVTRTKFATFQFSIGVCGWRVK